MSKHTDGAMKAAVEVIRELRLLVPSGNINAPKGTLAIQGTEIDLKDIAAIIDQETAAPDLLQLFAERDRLRAEKVELVEALREARVRLGFPVGVQPTDFFSIDYHSVADTVGIIDAALAKAETDIEVNDDKG